MQPAPTDPSPPEPAGGRLVGRFRIIPPGMKAGEEGAELRMSDRSPARVRLQILLGDIRGRPTIHEDVIPGLLPSRLRAVLPVPRLIRLARTVVIDDDTAVIVALVMNDVTDAKPVHNQGSVWI